MDNPCGNIYNIIVISSSALMAMLVVIIAI